MNKTVLVVDDNLDLQTVLSIGLAPLGIQVTACGTATEAIKAIESTRFDAAIIDLNLAEMGAGENGVELGKRIRQHPHGTEMRLILFSGKYDKNLVEKAFRVGFDDFLVKPVRMEQLLQKLHPPE